MDRTAYSSTIIVITVWLIATTSGCATNGDLENLRQELQHSIIDKTAPIEPLRADTKTRFDSLENDMAKLSQVLNGLQGKLSDIEGKSENLVKEREKVHALLQSAKRRILFLFKTEESELKDRIEFLRAAMKDFGAEESVQK